MTVKIRETGELVELEWGDREMDQDAVYDIVSDYGGFNSGEFDYDQVERVYAASQVTYARWSKIIADLHAVGCRLSGLFETLTWAQVQHILLCVPSCAIDNLAVERHKAIDRYHQINLNLDHKKEENSMSVQTHDLNSLAPYFNAMMRGEKRFDTRRDDRGFQKGDLVNLHAITKSAAGLTLFTEYLYPGTDERVNMLTAEITYILTGGQLGIEAGYVVLGLKFLTQRNSKGQSSTYVESL